jgi:hypothetical protein
MNCQSPRACDEQGLCEKGPFRIVRFSGHHSDFPARTDQSHRSAFQVPGRSRRHRREGLLCLDPLMRRLPYQPDPLAVVRPRKAVVVGNRG